MPNLHVSCMDTDPQSKGGVTFAVRSPSLLGGPLPKATQVCRPRTAFEQPIPSAGSRKMEV